MNIPELPPTVWLAGDYEMISTYSIRIPVSSQYSALSSPAPGPATVRLAMVRKAIGLFGLEVARSTFFPVIRSAQILIRPPERVAISAHLFRALKTGKSSSQFTDSLAYREICCAEGILTIYLTVPGAYEASFRKILQAIGYWGQADSLAVCTKVSNETPSLNECAQPLTSVLGTLPLGQFFACVTSEFRSKQVSWEEIMPTAKAKKAKPLELELFVWPMLIIEQHRTHKLLRRCSLV